MTITESTTARHDDEDSRFAKGVDKAAAGAHQKIDAAKDAAQPVMDHVVEGAHAAVDSMGHTATSTASAIDLKSEQFGEAKDELIKATRNYLQAHPIASLGMAAAAGYLVSRILSSR